MKDTSAPEISIVIPVYNGEEFLRSTIDNILHQTFQDFELIFVNDGSTDHTLEILQSYQQQTDKLTVTNQENLGPGVARNNGMKHARGKYLLFLDADDLFEPQLLQLAHDKIVADQSDIVVYRSDEYLSEENRYLPTDWTINYSLLPKHQPFSGAEIKTNIFMAFLGWPWDKLYRTEFVTKNHLEFQDLRSSEDALFVFMSIVRAERISTLDQVLIHHRRVGTSVSHTRETNWDSFYKALLAMRERLKSWGLYERYERDFVNYALHFSLWHLTTLSGDAYEKLFARLNESWWHELGIEQHGEDKAYFYNPNDYDLYRQVKIETPCGLQYFLRMKMENELALKDAQIYHLMNSRTWKTGRFVMLPTRVVKRIVDTVFKRH